MAFFLKCYFYMLLQYEFIDHKIHPTIPRVVVAQRLIATNRPLDVVCWTKVGPASLLCHLSGYLENGFHVCWMVRNTLRPISIASTAILDFYVRFNFIA